MIMKFFIENLQAVKLVMSIGIDVDISDTSGWTPLHWAGHWLELFAALCLLIKGFSVSGETCGGTCYVQSSA
jgi:hypothetical protein